MIENNYIFKAHEIVRLTIAYKYANHEISKEEMEKELFENWYNSCLEFNQKHVTKDHD